jgi:hypothetical protein
VSQQVHLQTEEETCCEVCITEGVSLTSSQRWVSSCPDHSRSDTLEAQPTIPQMERNIAGLEIGFLGNIFFSETLWRIAPMVYMRDVVVNLGRSTLCICTRGTTTDVEKFL